MRWKSRLRLRVARAVSSTRYVIFRADFVENLACRAGAAVRYILKSLPDALGRAGLGREIKKPLIGLSVLHHGGSLSVHRQNQRALGFFEVTQKLRRMVAERRHRLNVFRDVHRAAGSLVTEFGNIVPQLRLRKTLNRNSSIAVRRFTAELHH